VIKNWLKNKNTIELLAIWEYLHNQNFKPVEFDGFRMEAGLNGFVMTPKKWIEATNAILIHEGLAQRERLIKLNKIAIQQMSILQDVENRKLLR
jgi:hypothetical protein